jgi:hypothetical protein
MRRGNKSGLPETPGGDSASVADGENFGATQGDENGDVSMAADQSALSLLVDMELESEGKLLAGKKPAKKTSTSGTDLSIEIEMEDLDRDSAQMKDEMEEKEKEQDIHDDSETTINGILTSHTEKEEIADIPDVQTKKWMKTTLDIRVDLWVISFIQEKQLGD